MPIHCKGKMNMKKKNSKTILVALGTLVAFALWTFLIRCVDVQPIGPNGSRVGFAAINGAFHALTGVHWALYTLTDWLGLGFAVLGLVQLIRRKSLLKVDRDILILGGFYIVVLAAYLLFETVVINFRPVLIDGKLEASYPSSTTMLALCVLPTAMIQLKTRIRGDAVRRAILGIFVAFTVFMVVGRLLSGVHWLSDIVGGVLLSAGLVPLYALAVKQRKNA
jgi:membrane-associated phospholipid phosphatase